MIETCARFLKLDTSRHSTLHILHVNIIWALMEDAQRMVKDLSELRVTHNMNIEDEGWVIDERLEGSVADRLKGTAKFFDDKLSLESSLSRR